MIASPPAICLYFQMHQPYRLIEFDFFRVGEHPPYEHTALNAELLNLVADRCYLPATRMFHRLIEETEGRFRFSLSLSGVLLEQLESDRPDVLSALQKLVATGRVELLGETYHHSLASLFSKSEFRRQVLRHRETITEYFGVEPTVFRNTELIYSNALPAAVAKLGFRGVLAEGVTWLLSPHSPNQIFQPSTGGPVKLLLRNAGLSDDFAFRFSDRSWKEQPVTPAKALGWIQESGGEFVNLFMDLESIGEHQDRATGIFEFWDGFVREAAGRGVPFVCPAEALASFPAVAAYDCPSVSSWADHERDVSAWLGGPMQKEAATKVYAMGKAVRKSKDPRLIETWRRLEISDHFHYMSTKGGTDGMVHDHFRPYGSPHDAYIYFMNILADLQIQLDARMGSGAPILPKT